MSEELAISLRGVSKCFKRYDRPVDRLKELLIPGKSRAQEFWALRDIDLDVPKGQTLGIVGRNGSGKSTLLQIIAGTLTPTTGTVQVNGRVSALLELGSGFNPEFTGRQNVFFNGQLLGLTKGEVEERFDEIAAFADIGDFIDQPVKTYSSGMFVRLAFAVAIHVDPDILIVDEALSVGDGIFVHRCMLKVQEFKDHGGTILFVSHDIGSVTRLCSYCVWLKSSYIHRKGLSRDISRDYQAWIYEEINKSTTDNNLHNLDNPLNSKILETASNEYLDSLQNPFTNKAYLNSNLTLRFGTGKAEIKQLAIQDEVGHVLSVVYPNDKVIISLEIISHCRISSPIIGCSIYDKLRLPIISFNTYHLGYDLSPLLPHTNRQILFSFTWPNIVSGTYAFEFAIADGTQDSHEMLDWVQCAVSISALTRVPVLALLDLPEVLVSV
jgi:lipopolysaccharide transport system ATP-binding protein